MYKYIYNEKEKSILFFCLCLCVFGLSSLFYLHKHFKVLKCQAQDPLIRSRNKEPLKNNKNILLFSGSAHETLSKEVASSLGTNIAKIENSHFADGECHIRIIESIRGKEVYVIQPTCPPVNENLIELLLTISAMKRISAKKITAVIPYYGYARADRN